MYCGVDLTELERIARASQNPRFVMRIYRPEERALTEEVSIGRRTEILAGRFAAKEAAAKALLAAAEEQGGATLARALRAKLTFASIATLRTEAGAPRLLFYDSAYDFVHAHGVTRFEVSLSHTKSLAIAMVILS